MMMFQCEAFPSLQNLFTFSSASAGYLINLLLHQSLLFPLFLWIQGKLAVFQTLDLWAGFIFKPHLMQLYMREVFWC